jgi:glycosyltransferase involved in cell wall biosynthesis
VTLESIQQTGLFTNQDIWFVDDADDEYLATLYSASNLFVSTSLYEGFGLPLLEALACGLPAVVSRAGSLPEIGAGAADYITPTNVQGFSNAILLNAIEGQQPPSPVSLARAAEFSWENTARTYMEILIAASDKKGKAIN